MFSKLKRILHPENMLFKMIILNCGLLLLVTLFVQNARVFKHESFNLPSEIYYTYSELFRVLRSSFFQNSGVP